MKKILMMAVMIFAAMPIFSQDLTDLTGSGDDGAKKKYRLDRLMISTGYHSWLNGPSNIKMGPGRTFGTNLMFGKQFGNSPVSVALGIGVNADNTYSDAMPKYFNDTTLFGVIPDSVKYSKNKMNLAYVSLPLEIRFKFKENEKGKSFKMAIGGRISYLMSSHLKYNGDRYISSSEKIKVKEKTYDVKNIDPINYGATFRMAYGRYGLTVFYSLSPLFKSGKLFEMNGSTLKKLDAVTPFSVTLTITPS